MMVFMQEEAVVGLLEPGLQVRRYTRYTNVPYDGVHAGGDSGGIA